MPAEFINILDLPELEIGHSKRVLFSSEHFHTWIHGDYPGTKGPMHKHTADQQFYCIKGECSFHFPDAPSRKLTPGMLVTIPAGQLYQLDNTGAEYMILLGARAEPAAKPRFSHDDRIVGSGDYALKNLDKIKAPEDKKARARVLTGPKRLPVFEKFINDLRGVWADAADTESRMRRGAKLLEDLVKDESLRAHSGTGLRRKVARTSSSMKTLSIILRLTGLSASPDAREAFMTTLTRGRPMACLTAAKRCSVFVASTMGTEESMQS